MSYFDLDWQRWGLGFVLDLEAKAFEALIGPVSFNYAWWTWKDL
jgi:hypothetical protein